MTDTTSTTSTSIGRPSEASVQEWHRIVTNRDWAALPSLLVDDVTYHNPAQLEPYRGKDALVGVLRLVFSIFEDFRYLRRFDGVEGTALEFSARVGDTQLFGVDLVRFDATGRLEDLVVMLRPAAAVAKLGEEAAARMAADRDVRQS